VEGLCESRGSDNRCKRGSDNRCKRGSDNRCKQEFSQNVRKREDNMSTTNNLWVPEKVTEI